MENAHTEKSTFNIEEGRHDAVWVDSITKTAAHLSVDGTMDSDELRRAAVLFQYIANCLDKNNER